MTRIIQLGPKKRLDSKNRPDPKKPFGRRLRQLRKAKGWSQEELADEADLDRTFVSSCERGVRNLSLESICRLADALGEPRHSLLKPPGA